MDVKSMALALAFGSKSGGKTPTGTKQISINANGTVTEDVAEFASVEVSVDVPNPSAGTLEITENGLYDVTDYAGASVNIAASGGDDGSLDGMIDGTISGDISSNVATVSAYAFYNKDIYSVSFPNAKSVKDMAFSGCQMLLSANLPKVTSIAQYGFQNCYKLASITAPLLATAGNYAFSGCKSLVDAVFPNLSKIGTNMFYNCDKLEKCASDIATAIGNYGFYGCSSLKIVKILGSTSGSIGNYAFSSCSSLETLIITGTDGVIPLSATSKLNTCEKVTVYVPDELVDSYKSATNWITIADRIVGLSTYTES